MLRSIPTQPAQYLCATAMISPRRWNTAPRYNSADEIGLNCGVGVCVSQVRYSVGQEGAATYKTQNLAYHKDGRAVLLQ